MNSKMKIEPAAPYIRQANPDFSIEIWVNLSCNTQNVSLQSSRLIPFYCCGIINLIAFGIRSSSISPIPKSSPSACIKGYLVSFEIIFKDFS